MRSSAERNPLVASVKVSVEPTQESVNVVLSGGLQLEGGGKVEVLDLDRLQVDILRTTYSINVSVDQVEYLIALSNTYLDKTRFRDDALQLDTVDQRLFQYDRKHRAVVETVNVVPDFDHCNIPIINSAASPS
jgi:hypothetical protein